MGYDGHHISLPSRADNTYCRCMIDVILKQYKTLFIKYNYNYAECKYNSKMKKYEAANSRDKNAM